jgi:hypothetical protein
MVLVQIYINTDNNNSYFSIPLSGTCSIRVLNIQYNEGGTTNRVIQIQSDMLFLPYSPMRYITFMNGANSNINIDNSFKEYNFDKLYVRGQIKLYVVDIATGVQPAGFTGCIINLDVEELDSRSPQN